MAKPKLLVIPHTAPTPILVTRGEALAHGLAQDFDTYLLAWCPESFEHSSFFQRFLSKLRGVAARQRVEFRGDIRIIHTPLIYIRRPGTEFLRSINTEIVNRIIRKFGIEVVFNELALVNSRDLSVTHLIDIVDLPTERELKRWGEQAGRASGITTITHGLREGLLRYGMDAEVVGNGADIECLRSADGVSLRQSLGLENRLIIGHIGNHAEWSGLVFLLDVFKSLKKVIPEATLLIVGPGTEIPKAKAKASQEGIADVIFTGPVKATEVPRYFQVVDIGVMPFEMDQRTDVSFPITAIGFGAARKVAVATPLKGLQEIKMPYIELVEPNAELWVDAIVKAREKQWQDRWDQIVDQYDWKNLARKLSSYIKSCTRL